MKKLLIFLILLGSTLFAKAQQCDLEFSDSIVAPKNEVRIGNSYDVYVWVKNNGPQVFDGNIALHAFVGLSETNFNLSTPQSTIVIDSLKSYFYSIRPGETIQIKRSIFIDNKNFTADSGNIIIIWPSGKAKPGSALLKDILTNNNFAKPYLKVKVLAKGSKGNSLVTSIEDNNDNAQLFNCFPNPVDNILNINLKTSESIKIQIKDLNGRLVLTKNIVPTVMGQNFQINVKQELISNGFYILSGRTSTGRHFETKISINR